jgi:hypothetical protein
MFHMYMLQVSFLDVVLSNVRFKCSKQHEIDVADIIPHFPTNN